MSCTRKEAHAQFMNVVQYLIVLLCYAPMLLTALIMLPGFVYCAHIMHVHKIICEHTLTISLVLAVLS